MLLDLEIIQGLPFW